MTLENALEDTSYDLELERLQNKIMSFYTQLLTSTFKQSNPGASSDSLEEFLETNSISFKGSGFEEESNELESLLDNLLKQDDVDSVADKSYEKPDVDKGKELKSNTHEVKKLEKTIQLDIQEGLFRKYPAKREEISSQKIDDPTGQKLGNKATDDGLKRKTKDLRDFWEKERDTLLNLIYRRKRVMGL